MTTIRRTVLLALVGGIGALFGAMVLLYDHDATAKSKAFAESLDFLPWLFLMIVNTGLVAVAPFLIAGGLKKVWRVPASAYVWTVLALLVILALVAIPFALVRDRGINEKLVPLAHHSNKVLLLAAVGLVAAWVPCLSGIWLVAAKLELRSGRDPGDPDLDGFLELRNLLRRFLLILGTSVSLVTLSTGALRKALLASGAATEADYPVLLVLVYGAYFTVLLGVAYAPTYAAFRRTGRRLCDDLFPLPSPVAPSWSESLEKRQKLEAHLGIRVGTVEGFQSGLVILAPLASGIISAVLA